MISRSTDVVLEHFVTLLGVYHDFRRLYVNNKSPCVARGRRQETWVEKERNGVKEEWGQGLRSVACVVVSSSFCVKRKKEQKGRKGTKI